MEAYYTIIVIGNSRPGGGLLSLTPADARILVEGSIPMEVST